MKMTRRERLNAIFEGRTPDRSAVKIWGASPAGELVDPAFEPVRRLAVEKTDLFHGAGSAFDIYAGVHSAKLCEMRDEPTGSPDWVDQITTWHTPRGDLREVFLKSTHKKPGYHKEYMLKEPDDLRKVLSLPYEPYPFSADGYRQTEQAAGDTGITMFGLDHAMYATQRLIGSENFALWSLEAEDLLLEAMQAFSSRLRAHAKAAIDHGIRGIFGWVGPELCIPPLMSPAAFDRYVFALDKPIVDMVHNAGGRIWVHCHGKMSPVLRRFVDMGIDVLNPLEPPPMGDMTATQAFQVVGNRMGLEGGIETHDFMTGTKALLREKIRANLDAGHGRRFILGPSSGYTESVTPSPREIGNWLFYIEEAVRYAEEIA
jgi:hypothetical protein